MRAVRYLAMAALIAIVLVWLVLFVAGLPGRLALVRDNGMEPTVPQGSVMIIPEGKATKSVTWLPGGRMADLGMASRAPLRCSESSKRPDPPG